ncbi:TetR family transcriptional regulator [Streptomyces noursei ZPM]|uniref:TetR/AcrR family transcriptional regulator n=1 Tax=Streptomyces noursei TaxID=1971 RepID=UPI0005D8CB1C|nr:TetR/AcrR family transcriptional regulator [Streptomyces noursei]AKA01276.1 TetR family transcriptional regulator [Streptomyces noursei ZPM]
MTARRQRGGRPRDSRVDDKILQTTRELIDETGYPALTVDQVAARAGVGKAAIYRRYASKAEMAFAATMFEQQLPPLAGTGSLHGDLLALVRAFHIRMATPAARQLAPALISEIAVKPGLEARFQDTFLAAEQAIFAEIIERAVARGELAGTVDPAMAHLLLLGSLASALYIINLPVDDAMITDLATAATAGITALADRHHSDPCEAAEPPGRTDKAGTPG